MAEDLETFRAETRDWLEANCPPEMRTPMTSEKDVCWGGRNFDFQSEAQKQWLKVMGERGWTVPDWPKEYGGGGLSPTETKVLRQEMAALGCRKPLESFGISMLGPALLKYGTEEQKHEHLPKIARGEIRWCQGLGHEALHNAGLRDQRYNSVYAYSRGTEAHREAFRNMRLNDPASAMINPDHIIDFVNR
jgi:alkylation response protein AidB-like acyl-CoA dehydrogenase